MLSATEQAVTRSPDNRSLASASPQERALGILRQLHGFRDCELVQWRVLGTGGQGQTLSASRTDGTPVWKDHHQIAVKLFDSDSPEVDFAIGRQFETLRILHAMLDGRFIEGWNVRVPRPLSQCNSTLGLAMTIVPGDCLHGQLLRADRRSAEHIMSSYGSIAESLRRYWENNQRMYGDLQLENILCDLESQTISLVDPGIPCTIWKWEEAPNEWYPASRDLSYLLFDAAARSLKIFLTNPGTARRLNQLTERILHSFVSTVNPRSARLALLDEIRTCTQLHIAQLTSQRDVRGLWCSWVRRTASRSIEGTLRRVREQSDQPLEFPDHGVANGVIQSQGGRT